MVRFGNWLRARLGGSSVAGDAVSDDVPPGNPAAAEPAVSVPHAPSAAHEPVPGPFRIGWMTDTGMVRDHNEDAVLVFSGHQEGDRAVPPFGLFMVADGMGGHRDGEAASALALRACAGQLLSQVYLPMLSGTDRGANQPALTDVVRDAAAQANRVVGQFHPGSGSTLTYAMVLGPRLFVGHVGDSRAYLLRRGEPPRCLTQDHSFVGRLVEMGQLTPEEAAVHPQRNVLYQAIGQPESLEVDVATCLLKTGDRLLLCSDGLWNLLDEARMWAVVDVGGAPQVTCHRLVELANESGGYDNVTVMLIEIDLEQGLG